MLRKIIVALLGITLLSASVYAGNVSEGKGFIGFEVGKMDISGDTLRGDEDGAAYGIRLGAQSDTWRSTILFNYFDQNEQSMEKLLISVDYFLVDKNERVVKMKPYLGVNAGYANYEVTNTKDIDALIYGVEAGFVFNLSETIEVDFGYRYSFSTSDELDHTGNILFGLNYLY